MAPGAGPEISLLLIEWGTALHKGTGAKANSQPIPIASLFGQEAYNEGYSGLGRVGFRQEELATGVGNWLMSAEDSECTKPNSAKPTVTLAMADWLNPPAKERERRPEPSEETILHDREIGRREAATCRPLCTKGVESTAKLLVFELKRGPPSAEELVQCWLTRNFTSSVRNWRGVLGGGLPLWWGCNLASGVARAAVDIRVMRSAATDGQRTGGTEDSRDAEAQHLFGSMGFPGRVKHLLADRHLADPRAVAQRGPSANVPDLAVRQLVGPRRML
ncbi:hypothetical protein Esti_001327 [Eimeria stiedai]